MFFRFTDSTIFEAFSELNENLENREKFNITIAPITEDQIEAWMRNNLTPNIWERLNGRIRYTVTVMRHAEA